MKSTQYIGHLGERAAARYYLLHGAWVRKRNFSVGKHEIDIIAESPRYLIFSEVKTRTQDPERPSPYGVPSSAVTKDKQRCLLQAVRSYLTLHPTKKRVRLDVVEVYVSRDEKPRVLKVVCMPDAFHA